MSDIPKCRECEYCKETSGGIYAARNNFYCGHPNKSYIQRFYKEHRISRAFGFIDFGKPFEHKPAIKTSPKWCPERRNEEE